MEHGYEKLGWNDKYQEEHEVEVIASADGTTYPHAKVIKA
jgi:hypothetical protein